MASPLKFLKRLYFNKLLKPQNHNLTRFIFLSDVRVRFAPSPTGSLHLGGLRTAFYNYLFAKSNGGKFILRIEDTDQLRVIPSTIVDIEKDLQWLSITFDESPMVGGPFGPYIQTERVQIYKDHSKILLESDYAYKCFCTSNRLLALSKESRPYDNKCRLLSQSEIKRFEGEGTPYCIRLKLQKEPETFDDLIYGHKSIQVSEQEGDPVLMKTNGFPTYHLANVIDDHLMEITHVLRGVEWLASTVKHLLVYKAFKWKAPQFAHLPQMNNIDGSKLSKRNKSLHIGELRSQGYSPESVLNFIKFSGGGYEDMNYEKLSTLEELIQQFRIQRIGTNSTPIDINRLLRYSRMDFQNKLLSEHEQGLTIEKLRKDVVDEYGSRIDVDLSDSNLLHILNWGKNRVYKLKDFISPEFSFIWTTSEISIDKINSLKLNSKKIISEVVDGLNTEDFSIEKVKDILNLVIKKNSEKNVAVMQLLRIAVCGSSVGPPVAELFNLLGKEKCIQRLEKVHDILI